MVLSVGTLVGDLLVDEMPMAVAAMNMQAQLDGLDLGKRMVDPEWHDWGPPEEGGAAKPSLVL
jgi:hypothetical protein